VARECADGDGALRITPRPETDCILLDVRLPRAGDYLAKPFGLDEMLPRVACSSGTADPVSVGRRAGDLILDPEEGVEPWTRQATSSGALAAAEDHERQ
jgi:hypothetical protein